MVVVAFAWAGVFALAVALAILVPLSFALSGAVAPFSAAMVANPLVLLMAVMAGQLNHGRHRHLAWVQEC